MARELTFNITEDRRRLVEPTNVEGFEITFDRDIISGSKNWVDGRIGEDAARQVFVNVKYGPDNEAYDLTGIIPEFCGLTAKGGPENRNYSIIDNWHSVMVDPQGGRFRFDFPKDAFAVAGSYKQAFFNLKREGSGEVVATLEFDMKVMANFVYSNIIPKDFITPYLEVLDRLISEFKQGNVQKEELISELQKTVQNKLDIIEATFKSTNDTLESLRATANSLSEKIKQDGLFTQGEAEEFKQNMLTSVNNAISKYTDYEKVVDDITSDDGVDNVVNDLTFFSKSLNQDKFNALFLTDIHWTLMANDSDTNYATAGPKVIQQMMNTTVFDGNVDAVVVNGDNIHGNEFGTSKVPQNINRTKEFVGILNSTFIDTDVFVNMGNHDNGTVWSTAPSAVISQDDLVRFYGVDKAKFGETRNKFLAYKDYDSKKIRVITMNTFDNPDVLDGKQQIKYPTGKFSIFTNSQIQSLVRALQTVPDDYHVLVFTHQPLEGYFGNRPYDYMTNINHDVVKAILQGFATHTNVSITGVNSEFATSVTADFTQNKGTLIGVVSGHEHRDDTVQSQNGVNGFLRTCFISVGQDRTVGESTQYAFDVIEVDHDNRRITFKRFGKGDDYSYGY